MRVRLALPLVTGLAVLALPATASVRVSSNPTLTWQTNGTVSAIATVGSTVYVGGQFSQILPPSSSSGLKAKVRHNLAAFDLVTHKPLAWRPAADGAVDALAVHGKSLFIGGDFTHLNGRARSRLAAVSLKTGKLRPWHAHADGTVLVLVAARTRLYAGGDFHNVARRKRHRLAALSITTGRLVRSFHPIVSGPVRALALSPRGTRLFLGGDFKTVGGVASRHLAVVSTATGRASKTWRVHPDYPVEALAVTSTSLYVGGGGNGGHLAAFAVPSGRRAWLQLLDGDVAAVAVYRSTVYAGGHFDNVCVGNKGSGNPLTCTNGLLRRHLYSAATSSGKASDWAPDADSPLGVLALRAGRRGVTAGGYFKGFRPNMTGHFITQQGFAQFAR